MNKIRSFFTIKNRILIYMSCIAILLAVIMFFELNGILTDNIIGGYKNRIESGVGMLKDMAQDEFQELTLAKSKENISQEDMINTLNEKLDRYIDIVWTNNRDIVFGYYSNDLGVLAFSPDSAKNYKLGLKIDGSHFAYDATLSGKKLWHTGGSMRGETVVLISPIIIDGKPVGHVWGSVLMSSIREERNHMILFMSYITIIGVLLVFLFSHIISRKVAQDIKTLENGIEIMSYDINYRLPHMYGELSEICLGINEMAASLSGFYNFTVEVGDLKNVSDIYDRILGEVGKILNVNKMMLFTVNDSGNYKLVKVQGFSDDHHVGDDSNGLIKQVVALRKPLVAESICNDERFSILCPMAYREGIVSCAYVPLIIHNNVRGVMAVFSEEEGRFKKQHVSFLTTIASHGAYAVEGVLLQNKLEEEAISDPLTGLYNRRYLDIVLKEELCKAERFNFPVSCMIIDIDDFKKINDTYGHSAGDLVLKKLSEVIKSMIRGYDTPIRLGGEEFLIIMPQTYLHAGMLIAERLRENVESVQFLVDDIVINTTVSIGVAQWDKSISGSDLINNADEALYNAKNSGRNRVEKASPN